MKIYLVRHGEKDKDEFEGVLTEKGREQIALLAKSIKFTTSKIIYSSSFPRSVQSAEILSNLLGIPMKKIDSLREFSRNAFFQDEQSYSQEDKQNKYNLKLFLEEIISKGDDCLLAMHAGVNRFILSILLEIPLSKTLLLTHDLAGISELEHREIYGEKKWCLNLLNYSPNRYG